MDSISKPSRIPRRTNSTLNPEMIRKPQRAGTWVPDMSSKNAYRNFSFGWYQPSQSSLPDKPSAIVSKKDEKLPSVIDRRKPSANKVAFNEGKLKINKKAVVPHRNSVCQSTRRGTSNNNSTVADKNFNSNNGKEIGKKWGPKKLEKVPELTKTRDENIICLVDNLSDESQDNTALGKNSVENKVSSDIFYDTEEDFPVDFPQIITRDGFANLEKSKKSEQLIVLYKKNQLSGLSLNEQRGFREKQDEIIRKMIEELPYVWEDFVLFLSLSRQNVITYLEDQDFTIQTDRFHQETFELVRRNKLVKTYSDSKVKIITDNIEEAFLAAAAVEKLREENENLKSYNNTLQQKLDASEKLVQKLKVSLVKAKCDGDVKYRSACAESVRVRKNLQGLLKKKTLELEKSLEQVRKYQLAEPLSKNTSSVQISDSSNSYNMDGLEKPGNTGELTMVCDRCGNDGLGADVVNAPQSSRTHSNPDQLLITPDQLNSLKAMVKRLESSVDKLTAQNKKLRERASMRERQVGHILGKVLKNKEEEDKKVTGLIMMMRGHMSEAQEQRLRLQNRIRDLEAASRI